MSSPQMTRMLGFLSGMVELRWGVRLGVAGSQPDFGISVSTTWSMLKLADLARGGNSLKLASHSISIGGAAYITKFCSSIQFMYRKLSGPRSNGSALRS